jgi:hypothetical protein
MMATPGMAQHVASQRIGAEREGRILARPQLGLGNDAQGVGGEDERRQNGEQRHPQDYQRAYQRAAVPGKTREESQALHQRISMRGSSHI